MLQIYHYIWYVKSNIAPQDMLYKVFDDSHQTDICTWTKATIETPEQCVKFVES